ncbi:glycosyltransferase family 2 protein [Streptococcus saliviloxodontae]|uniref:Glycosyltransferase involved in cell wall biosynthesis n=1 Tax=Streptococcus saliviloxodontae TaxID=1349416 RepID=A0ABS2PL06_9STRE|nr:glycosyltransferase family 2 protein [Streptococcus saliviloxodontae]MBM7635972.1 glycosyltransferase involved in cell wall biosynthesis [Streptococcus saliviloxodontae]
MSNITVSVVIPMYNVEEFLAANIESVLRQTYHNIEIICVDDGSTDSTKKILNTYQDSRISYVYQENQGVGKAKNTGFKLATGDYVLFLDSDDILPDGTIQAYVDATVAGEVDLVIGDYSLINRQGDIIETVPDNEITRLEKGQILEASDVIYTSPFPGNKMFRRQFLLDNELIFEPIRIAQDLNLFLRVLAQSPKVVCIDHKVLYYRVYDGSVSKSYDARLKAIAEVFEHVEGQGYDFYKQHRSLIETVKYNHVTFQLMKCMKIRDKQLRSEVFDFLIGLIKAIPVELVDQDHLVSEAREYTTVALTSKQQFLSMRMRWRYHGFHKKQFFKNFY